MSTLWRCRMASDVYTLEMSNGKWCLHFGDVAWQVISTLWRCRKASDVYTLEMSHGKWCLQFGDVAWQ
ncbi:hypothetical protein Bpfe_008211 [Biomphalaria pfeifferi]|uniref:Uncharacterized protein n=1 Tax=Biomphalaria pfeifferi TaxID=112525 RepID=A0AAD8FFI9_BIOPF|nr:hypothetical protein Bpfe_008211 [Biomphalaria pfeifferi]